MYLSITPLPWTLCVLQICWCISSIPFLVWIRYNMITDIVGVQKKSAKILTTAAKTVQTNKKTESGTKMAKKYQIMYLLWTLISQAWNGLLTLWLFKEVNCQICLKVDANVTDFSNPFSNMYLSGLEWSFAKIQKPRIISLALASPRKRILLEI